MAPTKTISSCLWGTFQVVEIFKVLGLVTIIAIGYVSMHHGYPFIFSISSDEGLAILSHSRRINTMTHEDFTRVKRSFDTSFQHWDPRTEAKQRRQSRRRAQQQRVRRTTTQQVSTPISVSETAISGQSPTTTDSTSPFIGIFNPSTSSSPPEIPFAQERIGRKNTEGKGLAEFQNKVYYPDNLVSCDHTSPPTSYAVPHIEHCLHKPDSDGQISPTRLTLYKVDPHEWQSPACWCTSTTTIKKCFTAFFGGETKTQSTRKSTVSESACANACNTMRGMGKQIVQVGEVGDWDCNWLSTTTKSYYVITAQIIQVHLDTLQNNVITPVPPTDLCTRHSETCTMVDGGILIDFSFPDENRCRLVAWMTATCVWSNTWNVEGFSCPQQGLSFTFSRPYHEYECKGERLVMTDQGHLVSAGWFNNNVDVDEMTIENWTPRVHMSSDLSSAGDQYLLQQLNAYSVSDARRELEMMCESRNRDILTARAVSDLSGKVAVRLLTGRSDITGQINGGIMVISTCAQYTLKAVLEPENYTDGEECSHRWPVEVESETNVTITMYYDQRDGELYDKDDRYTCNKVPPFWFPGFNDTVVDLTNPDHTKNLYDNDYHRFGAIGHPMLTRINRTSLFSSNELLFSQSSVENMRQIRDYMYHRDVAVYGESGAMDPGRKLKNKLSEGETKVARSSLGLSWLESPLGWLSARIGGLFGSIGTILCMAGLVLLFAITARPAAKTVKKAVTKVKTPQNVYSTPPKKKTTKTGVANRAAEEPKQFSFDMDRYDSMV